MPQTGVYVGRGLLVECDRSADFRVSPLDFMQDFDYHGSLNNVTWTNETEAFYRTGPPAILVDRDSATNGSIYNRRDSTIRINAGHSGIAKFKPGDPAIYIIISKLQRIQDSYSVPPPEDDLGRHYSAQSTVTLATLSKKEGFDWDLRAVVSALHTAERDLREERIVERFKGTFSWASFGYAASRDLASPTLEKFIYSDPRTVELLHAWDPSAEQAEKIKIVEFLTADFKNVLIG
ncbi:hypothetical protein B0H67DRAFT_647435 [Lasiosphaeris hirsuta]|uniref:Uncharacterized protein n=1 Tax=Lasiosphaeris hirsuta TaxID=260670 RepID=A0AA40DUB6_9PEZI|nr:hypothetical protein B0H67DRAFT_647435 [Lasiosphaeris hirsuta]